MALLSLLLILIPMHGGTYNPSNFQFDKYPIHFLRTNYPFSHLLFFEICWNGKATEQTEEKTKTELSSGTNLYIFLKRPEINMKLLLKF